MLDDKALPVDGAVDDERVGPTSADNSLARALGSPNGRHQRWSMRTMIHQRRRPNFGPDPTMKALDITGAWPRLATAGSDEHSKGISRAWQSRRNSSIGQRRKASKKSSDTPFEAVTPSAHPPYDSCPVELELRMATASARRRRQSATRNCGVVLRVAGTAAAAASSAAGRPLGIRSCSAVAAMCIDHVSSAQCFVPEDSVPSRRNPVVGTVVSGCSHRHVGTADHGRHHCTARVRMRLSACYRRYARS